MGFWSEKLNKTNKDTSNRKYSRKKKDKCKWKVELHINTIINKRVDWFNFNILKNIFAI